MLFGIDAYQRWMPWSTIGTCGALSYSCIVVVSTMKRRSAELYDSRGGEADLRLSNQAHEQKKSCCEVLHLGWIKFEASSGRSMRSLKGRLTEF